MTRATGFLKYIIAVMGLLISGVALAQPAPAAQNETAIFAGGCFWCVESDFDKVPGVLRTESGYIGGTIANPTYEQVSHGGTGHAEAVRITYNPAVVSYTKLLDHFWRTTDPTVKDRQFCDVGSQYRTAIFTANDAQKTLAEQSKMALQISSRFKDKTIFTQIVPAGPFTVAEEYHQDYYRKNPVRYSFYRKSCGRDARIAEVWGDAK